MITSQFGRRTYIVASGIGIEENFRKAGTPEG